MTGLPISAHRYRVTELFWWKIWCKTQQRGRIFFSTGFSITVSKFRMIDVVLTFKFGHNITIIKIPIFWLSQLTWTTLPHSTYHQTNENTRKMNTNGIERIDYSGPRNRLPWKVSLPATFWPEECTIFIVSSDDLDLCYTDPLSLRRLHPDNPNKHRYLKRTFKMWRNNSSSGDYSSGWSHIGHEILLVCRFF